MWIVCLAQQTIHMKCLILSEKKKIKMSAAVVVIDALRIKHARKYWAVIWKNLQSHKQIV